MGRLSHSHVFPTLVLTYSSSVTIYLYFFKFRVDPSRLLVSLGASVDCKDNGDNTALHWAIKARNASAISLLIEKKAPLDAANNKV